MNKSFLRKIIYSAAIILFGVMTAAVSYNYAAMECAISHQGASAPATVAFIYAIPFVIAIAICLIIGRVLKEKK